MTKITQYRSLCVFDTITKHRGNYTLFTNDERNVATKNKDGLH